jgi:uncharacterized sulfatase
MRRSSIVGGLLLAALGATLATSAGVPVRTAPQRPNIVWIVLDDASPAIGADGDPQATTPNIDRLASQGVRFTHSFTHYPGCAPSRFGLVTGVYPTSVGSNNMRSRLIDPPPTFMSVLKQAGYYVSWPGKMDFNMYSVGGTFNPKDPRVGWTYDCPDCWNDQEPWLDGPPPREPFFAYLDVGVVHESHVRDTPEQLAKDTERLTPSQRHDPAKMRVPAYYPDVPAVRRDLANFYDLMTAADYQVGDVMDWLDRYHLADRTVVWVFGDHGTGLPRMKRWLYDSGLRTDLVIRWPGQIAPGTVRDAPVAFVDFAPTVLSIAGAPIPKSVEGQVFLGPNRAKDRDVVFGARDRFDNADDRIRSARDSRYEYIRNYHPELPYSQPMPYAEAGNTMKAWRALAEAGRLEGASALFFAAVKPPQELYDTQTDPDEVNNLAGDPRYAAIMARLSDALDRWMKQTGDLENVTTDETASAASNRGQLVVSRKRVH